jgi:hypothetical protein
MGRSDSEERMDMQGRWRTLVAPLSLAATVGLTGCATLRGWQARDSGQLLAAAGFEMQIAATAEQQQRLEAMPPYRLVSRTKDGSAEYTYADPQHCRCLYVGGPNEYAKYQRLTMERQIAQERRWAAQERMGWGWGPSYLPGW